MEPSIILQSSPVNTPTHWDSQSAADYSIPQYHKIWYLPQFTAGSVVLVQRLNIEFKSKNCVGVTICSVPVVLVLITKS